MEQVLTNQFQCFFSYTNASTSVAVTNATSLLFKGHAVIECYITSKFQTLFFKTWIDFSN